mgnify:CR=1 FL=1
MTNDEKAMYTGMAMSRNTEVTLRWSRSQMFMIINSAMLSVMFTRDAGFWLLFLVSIFGMIMAAAWLMINEKSQQWVEYWQTRLAQIKHEEEPATVNVFIGPEWDTINKGWTFHRLLTILPCMFTMVWIGVFVFSFTRP